MAALAPFWSLKSEQTASSGSLLFGGLGLSLRRYSLSMRATAASTPSIAQYDTKIK